MIDLIAPSQNYEARIILLDSGDFSTPETGVLSTAVTIKYAGPGASSKTTVADKSSWAELGEGEYKFTFTAAQIGATEGIFTYTVAAAGILIYYGAARIKDFNALVQAALTALGYTSGRAPNLDNLDATVSSRASQASVDALPSAADIADAVWDEAIAGHLTAGSTGAALNALPSAATVADAVWDEAIAAHLAAGSTGAALNTAASSAGGADQKVVGCLVVFTGADVIFRVFLQINGQLDQTGTAARITVYEHDGTEAIAIQTDSTPDAQGMFSITVADHPLSKNRNYMVKAEIDVPGPETVQSWQGFSTA